MADVFISYSKADGARVSELASALRAMNIDPWLDQRLEAGETFDRVIEDEIGKARAVVVCWTNNAVQSEWVRNEAGLADDQKKYIGLIFEKPCNPPMPFRSRHHLNLSGWSGGVQSSDFLELIKTLGRRLERQELVQQAEAGLQHARETEAAALQAADAERLRARAIENREAEERARLERAAAEDRAQWERRAGQSQRLRATFMVGPFVIAFFAVLLGGLAQLLAWPVWYFFVASQYYAGRAPPYWPYRVEYENMLAIGGGIAGVLLGIVLLANMHMLHKRRLRYIALGTVAIAVALGWTFLFGGRQPFPREHYAAVFSRAQFVTRDSSGQWSDEAFARSVQIDPSHNTIIALRGADALGSVNSHWPLRVVYESDSTEDGPSCTMNFGEHREGNDVCSLRLERNGEYTVNFFMGRGYRAQRLNVTVDHAER